MSNKVKIIAAIVAFGFASPAAALAQSAYTTGTAASSAAAGYPSPDGYGGGLYAYDSGYGYWLAAQSRKLWDRTRVKH
jgi:hypothetical protein